MADHVHTPFDYDDPSAATNANNVPGENLARALAVLHYVMVAGGVVPNWKMQKLNSSDVEVEELPDKVVWSHKAGNEKLRATITRDVDDLVTTIVFAFAANGTTFTTIKTASVTRGTNDGVKNVDWS